LKVLKENLTVKCSSYIGWLAKLTPNPSFARQIEKNLVLFGLKNKVWIEIHEIKNILSPSGRTTITIRHPPLSPCLQQASYGRSNEWCTLGEINFLSFC